MKTNIKRLCKAGALLLVLSLFLAGCQKEENLIEQDGNTSSSRFKVELLNKEELYSNKQVGKELGKLKEALKNTPAGKENRERLDLSIIADSVKYVENLVTGEHTYNFPMKSDSLGRMRNFVLAGNNQSEYEAFTVTYGFTEQEYQQLDGSQLSERETSFSGAVKVDDLVKGEIWPETQRYIWECIEVWVQVCIPADEGDLVGEHNPYDCSLVLVADDCYCLNCPPAGTPPDGGDDGGGYDGGGPGDNGSGGPGSSNPGEGNTSGGTTTFPTGCRGCPEIGIDGETDDELAPIEMFALLSALELNEEQVSWLMDEDNSEPAQQLYDYLNASGCLALNPSACEEGAVEFAQDIVEAGTNSSIVSSFPFVKYPEDLAEEYTENYPNLTQYLKEELPKLAEDELIVNALQQFGSLNEEQIMDALNWGDDSPVTIRIIDMPCCWGAYGPQWGYDESTILISTELANELEDNSSISEDALNFFVAVIILHEVTHLGDYLYNDDMYEGEEGNDFELYVTGTQQTNPNDANEVYQGYLLKKQD